MLRITDQPQKVHNAVQIFGNTLRLGIIRQLALGKDNRSDIAKALEVSEDALTRQIGLLVDHGLVDSVVLRAKGRPVRYSLNKEAVQELFTAMGSYWQGKPLPIEEEQKHLETEPIDSRSYRKRRQ